jgi:hypothetical protein
VLDTELERPEADGFVRDFDAALQHHLLYVAEAQAETIVEPNAVSDDLGREAVTAVRREGRDLHPLIASRSSRI